MKTKVMIFFAICITFIGLAFFALDGRFSTSIGAVGNPTVSEILKGNPDADILKLDGLVYTNTTELPWTRDMDFTKGDLIGKVNRQTTNTWWFFNLYASKLPKGTKVYTANENEYEDGDAPWAVLVEYEGELLIYEAMVEG